MTDGTPARPDNGSDDDDMTDEDAETRVRNIFDDVGVKTLEAWLEEPDWVSLTDEDVKNYSQFAAMTCHGPRLYPNPVAPDEPLDIGPLVRMYTHCLSAALSHDGPSYLTDDGKLMVEVGGGMPDAEVTPRSLRHWEWMIRLCTDDKLARRFLDTMPADARDAATAWAKGKLAEQLVTIDDPDAS